MADESKNTEKKKIVDDVTKPGETPANATSRPVIVKHRSVMKDPMMAEPNPSQMDEKEGSSADKTDKTEEDKDDPVSRKAPKLQPSPDVSATEKSDTPEENENENENEKEKENENEKASSPQEKPPEDKEAPTEDNGRETGENNSGTGAVDVLASEAVKGKKDSKEQREKREAIEKHIEEKTYFAPIGRISKRRAKIRIILFILFLIALAGGYLAIDAEVIDLGIELPLDIL
ncbi:MAG: hypothetical protein U5L95_05385 [Candidatus Saccharibacteria bacterium]|nr:hypothetical protein [Candidatus Saccharibacteria bacterium]